YLFILFLFLVFLSFIFLSILFSFYYISTSNLQFIMILINTLIIPVVFYMKEKINYKLLFIFILLFLIVYLFGNVWKTAQVNTEYITFNKNEETFIVLTKYKNQFLYASIDEGTKEINKEFSIIDMQDIDHFKIEKLKNEN